MSRPAIVETPHHHPAHHALHKDPSAAALALAQEEAREQEELAARALQRANLYAVGRLLVAAVFVIAGVVKGFRFEETRVALEASNVAAAGTVLGIAIAVEVLGGALLALGFRTRRAAVGLMAYLAVVSTFLLLSSTSLASVNFAMTNVAFIGGLMMLAAHGAGPMSLDRKRQED